MVRPAVAASADAPGASQLSYRAAPGNGLISAGAGLLPSVEVGGTASYLNVYASDGKNTWTVTLAAATGSTLTAGSTYTNVGRAPTASSASLDLTYGSLGCSTQYADFTVYQISTDDKGNVTSLEVGFDQNCSTSASAPSVNALIRYNATEDPPSWFRLVRVPGVTGLSGARTGRGRVSSV